MELLDRLERGLVRLLDAASVAMLAALIAVIAWSVFSRQVLRVSVAWAEEIGAGLLVWLVATGAAAAWSRRTHIAIDVLPRRLAPRPRHALMILIELTSLLLFAVALAGSYLMMFVSAHNTTTALGISFTYLYLALVIGLGGMILFSLLHLARLIGRGPAMAADLYARKDEEEWSTLSSS
jgi:TRAP-type transport system small permease protein